MRECYIDLDTRSIADLSMAFEDVWMLHRVNVPMQSRGFGHGGRMLRKVLAAADEEGATIALIVHPSGPLDHEALTSWYQRHGFTHDDAPDWEMIRYPRSQ